jgi:hypothetical protein
MATEAGRVYVDILTPLPLSAREDGERILNLWEKHLPDCLPDRYGNWEPIDQVFDPRQRDTVLNHWQWPFLAERHRPKMEASVWMRKGKKPLHASWKFAFNFGEVSAEALRDFLRAASVELMADFSCITLLTQSEIDFGRLNRTAWNLDKRATRFDFAIYSQFLQKCIPDLYWVTVFGAPYVEMFGKSKLLSAPVYKAEALSDDIVLLQLTPSLEAVQDAGVFGGKKAVVKEYLGEEAFYKVGNLGTARHPAFVWH